MKNIDNKNKKQNVNQAPQAPRVLDADSLREVRGGLNFTKITYVTSP